jgi:hypothetical protein
MTITGPPPIYVRVRPYLRFLYRTECDADNYHRLHIHFDPAINDAEQHARHVHRWGEIDYQMPSERI